MDYWGIMSIRVTAKKIFYVLGSVVLLFFIHNIEEKPGKKPSYLQRDVVKFHPIFRERKPTSTLAPLHIPTLDQSEKLNALSTTKGFKIALILTFNTYDNPKIQQQWQKMPIFTKLIPSFCKTATAGLEYHFYLCHDSNDPFWDRKFYTDRKLVFQKYFTLVVENHCEKEISVKTKMILVSSTYSKQEVQSYNDAVFAAFLDDVDYIYKIRDDTVMITKGWAEMFIEVLTFVFLPSNTGVVSPSTEDESDTNLQLEFFHKSHIEIFGYLYPHSLKAREALLWISHVYSPKRIGIFSNVKVKQDTTYDENQNDGDLIDTGAFAMLVTESKETLEEWISPKRKIFQNLKGHYVISYGITGAKADMLYGAIRNAQLAKLYFPHWNIRFYMENPLEQTKWPAVPYHRIVKTLERYGAEIKYLKKEFSAIPPTLWKTLIFDDGNVDFFIIRDASGRLSAHDAKLVSKWVKTKTPVHIIRDSPAAIQQKLPPGSFGGSPMFLQDRFFEGGLYETDKTWQYYLYTQVRDKKWDVTMKHLDSYVMNNVVSSLLRNSAFQRNRPSCRKVDYKIPYMMKQYHFVGHKFKRYDVPLFNDEGICV